MINTGSKRFEIQARVDKRTIKRDCEKELNYKIHRLIPVNAKITMSPRQHADTTPEKPSSNGSASHVSSDPADPSAVTSAGPGSQSQAPRMTVIDEADEFNHDSPVSKKNSLGARAPGILKSKEGNKRKVSKPSKADKRSSGKASVVVTELRDQTQKTIDTKESTIGPEEKSKTDPLMMRYKPRPESAPKVEGETNTDTTHDINDDDEASDVERSSSLNFRLTSDRSDKDQECDSSSSSNNNSGSDTQKTTDGGLYDNDKGDKYINASRVIFFTVLGISAIVISLLAYYFFRKEETKSFEKQFKAQAEELRLYTQHNVDSAFATLQGLSVSTISVIKRQAEETDWPAGFINVPDVQYNLGLARNASKSLALAYMPKVTKGNYKKWINYSAANKDWIAEEQSGGPVDLEPVIRDYIWEYTDYDFEKPDKAESHKVDVSETPPARRKVTEDMPGQSSNTASKTSLRGFAHRSELEDLERPVDCSQNQGRRRRHLSDMEGNDDNRFFGIGNEFVDDEPYRFESDDDFDFREKPEPSSIMVAPPEDAYQTPVWQISPIPSIDDKSPDVQVVNYNLADRIVFYKAVEYMENSRAPVFLDVCDQSSWFFIEKNKDILQTVMVYPVFEDFLANSDIVGYFAAIIPWKEFFVNNLGEDTNDMIVVMNNTCGEVFSLNVTKRGAEIIGEYDEHDTTYDDIAQGYPFAEDYNRVDFAAYKEEICIYNLTMYPTKQFENAVRSKRPLVIGVTVFMVFILTSFGFMLFDCLVTQRQKKLLKTAKRQNALVNSLFPKNIQKKLIDDVAESETEHSERTKHTKKRNLNTFLIDDQSNPNRKQDPLDSKPIADLFPHTTIMFADISGFTAWSSAREPAAVFTLLETIYRAFDEIAKRRKVFKVEVVGDCYVAVCGLPDPRKDHYAVMCRFAQDCMAAMHVHTKELEVRLGPDTGDLSLRIGLHSGPVVAGVLRGDKSRFQLFGDTMNTASRMESTGTPNRIQLSQATADLLILDGKEHWITKRLDKVSAKGKGDMTTYFLLSVKKKTSSTTSAETVKINEVVLVRSGNPSSVLGAKSMQKRNRVADWVVEMLGKLLKEMKAKRKLTGIPPDSRATIKALESRSISAASSVDLDDKTVIDEVAECLKLPGLHKSDQGDPSYTRQIKPTPLDKEVTEELQHYVYTIASLYKDNPFHNFEHASHVSMSCIKLLNRIASHDEENMDSSNHHTYGICCDPLTSFAIVFSALIHDVDHCGVPNAQLVKEHAEVATMYKNKSVAEQNSIDIGWSLLMEPAYSNLRKHIYTTTTEYKCFRQIVVNCIMATDICDKDLIKARNKRWDLAFSSGPSPKPEGCHDEDYYCESNSRKATVVVEHLIQLSDVSHTMQHWHMYRRWNERLFEEGYKAFIEGRAEKDPSEGWYQGELGFYDFYIIPLAKKIKQCAVFGVSSDEYLGYALANREEWEERGKEVVKDMVNKVQALYHKGNNRRETGSTVSSLSPTFRSRKNSMGSSSGVSASDASRGSDDL